MRVRVAAAGWRAGRGSCFDIIAPSLASDAIPGYRSAHPPLGAHMPAVGHRRPFLLDLTGAGFAATQRSGWVANRRSTRQLWPHCQIGFLRWARVSELCVFRNDGVRRRRPIHPERLPENYEPSKNRFVVRSISLRMGHKIASHRCSHICIDHGDSTDVHILYTHTPSYA